MDLLAPEKFIHNLITQGAGALQGIVMFGPKVWNSYTPEQQATIEAAIAKGAFALAQAYVGKSNPVA